MLLNRLAKTVFALIWVACSTGRTPLLAQSVSDFAVRISAVAEMNPPRITLSWPSDPAAWKCRVFRKQRDDPKWGSLIITLAGDATGYVDTNVNTRDAYEYLIIRDAPTYSGRGYIYAGIEAPLVEFRGKVVLLVDKTLASNLASELARLQLDLVGDGWTVLRHDVGRMAVDPADASSAVWSARSNELASLKAVITADYDADPANVKSVFLFGHLPVPYSGNLSPDGHIDHAGAWPADAFYGDMDGLWTDSTVTSTGASDPRNRNVPGDGKFDPSLLPSSIELEVGRVDLANLPTFPQNEEELLRRYLNKDHCFRHRLTTAERRGLIDDHFGLSTGEPFAVSGWRNFAAFFGASNTVAGDWLTTLNSQTYLWGYGCGAGTFTSCSGVASTAQLASSDPWVVFTMLFGSYFGDWDSQDNFLRAALATPSYTLTSVWAGRPHWQFHQMALGETIGFSARRNHNNNTLYSTGYARSVHIALMGDPTLRMHPVAPPLALVVVSNQSGGVDLTWSSSPDTVAGYHVYRAPNASGPFTRLTGALISGTNYTVPGVSSDVFMVRAVKLEVSGSGTYYNPSQGIFQSLDGTAGAPGIALLWPTNNAQFNAPANIQLIANKSDPANCITNVAFYANGLEAGQADMLSGSAFWSNAPAGTYSVIARATCASGEVTNSSAVTVIVEEPNSAPFLTPLSDHTTDEGTSTGAIPFTVSDSETLADNLVVTGRSSNSTLVPNTSIVFGGAGNNRTITITPVSNLSGNTTITVTVTDAEGGSTSKDFSLTVAAAVRGRHLFYNESAFDGNDPAANPLDDGAMAIDKRPLLPGETASFANYTSYSKGINGMMVDIAGLVGAPGANDFILKTGNSGDPASWTTAPAPLGICVRPGAGVNGSSRVTILWPNNAIQKQWLQVTVLATAVTGLGAADLFYFGNVIGDSGNSLTDARVNATDEIAARNNMRATGQAPIDFAYDYNRDRKVNATDEIIARNNSTSSLTALQLIHVPPVISGVANSAVPAASRQLTAASSPAVVLAVSIDGDGRLHIRLPEMSVARFVLEGADSLTRPAWVKLVPQPPLSQSDNGYEFMLETEPGGPTRFYRLLVR